VTKDGKVASGFDPSAEESRYLCAQALSWPYGRFKRSLLCDNLYHGYRFDQVIPTIKRRATACVTDHVNGPGVLGSSVKRHIG